MASRTSEPQVENVLMKDYDSSKSLAPFIDTANILVTWLDGQDTAGELSDSHLELIERWLSAHFYVQSDQTLASKNTGKSGGSFHGQTGMGLENSKYGQTAMTLDITGKLAARNSGNRVFFKWAGKKPSEQDPDNYSD